jgi:hypothetical protein
MYYIGLDVHKKTISYCVKDVSGRIQQEGKVGSTRRELDCWMKTLPQPWTVAMEGTNLQRLDLRSSASARYPDQSGSGDAARLIYMGRQQTDPDPSLVALALRPPPRSNDSSDRRHLCRVVDTG